MDLRDVTRFFEKAPYGFLATLDGEQPRVRPLMAPVERGGRLWFCTANTKPLYRQLRANPRLEFSATSSEMITIRIQARAAFSEDREMKAYFLDNFPLVRQIYGSPDNPIFAVFSLEEVQGVTFALDGRPPVPFAL
jgi:uncharacterized pyridoxamine 5'-phosphate oxidase family protein